MKNKETHVILKVTEYGFNNETFTLVKMKKDIQLTEIQYDYVVRHLAKTKGSQADNPIHILAFVHSNPNSTVTDYHGDTYSLLPDALFSYVDHLEIVEARKAAKEARRLSIAAIIISSILAIAQIIFAINFDK